MASNKEIDKAVKLTNVCLLASGLNIKQTKEKSFLKDNLEYLYYLTGLWIYTDIAAQILWIIQGIKAEKTFEELTYIAPCITVSVLGTSKNFFIKKNIQMAKNVLKQFCKLHPNKDTDDYDDSEIAKRNFIDNELNRNNEQTNDANVHKRNEINKLKAKTAKDRTQQEKEDYTVKDSMKKLNLTMTFVFVSYTALVIAFSCMPLVFMTINYYKTGEIDVKYPLLCNYWIFDSESFSPLIYLHHVGSVLIAAANLYGTDSMFFAFCTFSQMHFRMLAIRMENVVGFNVVESKKKLSELVKSHQELIEIVDQIQILYGKSTLVNFIASSFLICLSGFNVLTIKDAGAVVSFITFLFVSMVQVFVLCFCGDMVMRTSMAVGGSAYKCLWYNTDPEFQRNIHIIIFRSQKACKITAENFGDLNLAAFTTVLSRSWSYFALLNTMYS